MEELIKKYIRPYKGTSEQIEYRVRLYCEQYNLTYANILIFDDYVTFIGCSNIEYNDLVNKLVKERYSDSEEFAILRKAINNVTDEYLIYNSYVEECKTKAKQFILEREAILNENNSI